MQAFHPVVGIVMLAGCGAVLDAEPAGDRVPAPAAEPLVLERSSVDCERLRVEAAPTEANAWWVEIEAAGCGCAIRLGEPAFLDEGDTLHVEIELLRSVCLDWFPPGPITRAWLVDEGGDWRRLRTSVVRRRHLW